MMTINKLKKELGLTNTDIAELFDLSPIAYANSSAKVRYESALCKFYEKVKEICKNAEQSGLNSLTHNGGSYRQGRTARRLLSCQRQ